MNLKTTMEQSALLGAYPLLALTVTGYEAVAGLLVVLAAALLAGLASLWLRRIMPSSVVWLVNIAAAAGGALTTALLLPYLFPIPELSTRILAIAGVTPIAFVFCRPRGAQTAADSGGTEQPAGTAVFASFAAFMIVTAILREVLGAGALFNAGVTPGGAIPAGIMSTHAGGFLILALILFSVRVYGAWRSSSASSNTGAQTQPADGGTR